MSDCLIHVVPQLPPNVSGVGDYAVVLGRRVAEQTGGRIHSAYVQAGYADGDAPSEALTSVDLRGHPSAKALVEAVGTLSGGAEQAAVLVHFVGYGYQQRGCPLWLVRALRQLKDERPGLGRLTMFHELYATSWRPWTSSFWTAPAQRHVAIRVAQLSDGLMTNRPAAARWLRQHAGSAVPVRVSPTFSNVGEPEDRAPCSKRQPFAVTFGGQGRKKAVYQRYAGVVRRILNDCKLEKIVDIGSFKKKDTVDLKGAEIERVGHLAADDISDLLKKASLGLIYYPADRISKSGVMAAYVSHAVPTALFAENSRGLQEQYYEGGQTVAFFSDSEAKAHSSLYPCDLERLSRKGWQTYHRHMHSRKAAKTLLQLARAVRVR